MPDELKIPQGACIRCGQCMAVCPVYLNSHMETDVARGRLSVLKQGETDEKIARSAIMREVLTRCLLCGACENTCANKVPVTKRVIEGREIARKKFNLPKQVQLAALTDEGLAGEILRKGGKLAQSLIGGKIDKSSGLYLRFPLASFSHRKVIPSMGGTPWLEQRKDTASSAKGLRVGFFVGCGTNHLFQDSAQALERLGQLAGLNIITVPDQGCCGLPAYASGDRDSAIACAQKNLDAFSQLELDAVVTNCASCGSHLKNLPALFGEGSHYHTLAVDMLDKHQDAAQVLLGSDIFLDVLKNQPAPSDSEKPRVYYHTPCHLRFGKSATSAPLDLLKALGDRIDLIPPENLTRCCGHGGGFNIDHHGLSMDIHQSCLGPILEENPQIIATGCTGCTMQFVEGLYVAGKPDVEILHPLVLVDRVLGGDAN